MAIKELFWSKKKTLEENEVDKLSYYYNDLKIMNELKRDPKTSYRKYPF